VAHQSQAAARRGGIGRQHDQHGVAAVEV
jgi:hypothetical protein